MKFGKASKLTSAQVEGIRKMVIEGYNKTEIVQKFNVSRQTIYNVLEWYLSVYFRTEKGRGMVKIYRGLLFGSCQQQSTARAID